MQNKPNFRKTKMNLNSYLTKDYENERLHWTGKTKPIQTQYKANTNPIPERPKMNENLFATKVYENITTFRLRQNKPNTKPIQTQSNPTCSELACPELACGELVEPVEGVEPIFKNPGYFHFPIPAAKTNDSQPRRISVPRLGL